MGKYGSLNRHGETLEITIRDSSFRRLFKREVNINDKKQLEILLRDLKDKGVDLIGIIRRKMSEGSGWFD